MPDVLVHASWGLTAAIVFATLLALTVNGAVTGFIAERAFPQRRIMNVPLFPGQYRFELLGNAVFLAITTATITAALRLDAVVWGPPGLARGLATWLAMHVGFQVSYWLLHRAMHTRALVKIHRWHHRSQTTTPLTGQSMSAAEAALWMLCYVGLPVVLSRVAPLSFWGWAGYLTFNVLGNVFGHANVECTLEPGSSRAATFFANVFVYHALHHARWTGHYGFAAAAVDRIMGTEWSDWPVLYQRVIHGQPLTSLKERGDA
jgi:sterol desaturase/sphingolipid hydroxylase (fatty acid hydroxylase superfamily)